MLLDNPLVANDSLVMDSYSNVSTMEVSESIVLTRMGEMPAFKMILIQRINRIICSTVGIPLNILVLIVVLRSRQLWSPRNIFWFGVTFFNVIAILQSVAELVVYYLYKYYEGSHEPVCKLYVALVGGPYGTLLACLTLASCDRYLALARQQFYQNYVTTKNATRILLFCFVTITGMFLLQWTADNCTVYRTNSCRH